MMRLNWATFLALLITAPSLAQQQSRVPDYARGAQQATNRQAQRTAGAPQARIASAPQAVQAPFAPLDANALAQLRTLLNNWEAQSQGTKTLECKFKRWHFDMFAAPAGIHATHAEGSIKYAAPDKGLFRVDSLLFYSGMVEGKPQYKSQPGKFGEHWVCNGEQLIEFDRTKKECRIQDLPENLQGKEIFNSPLPFVFNLDAQQIQQRYWVRQVQAPKEGIILIEAWPKLQEDRAQYKLVQIALGSTTYLPEALIMYAPNFHQKTAPRWDHYEFTDVKRNAITQGINKFFGNFIPEKPPSDWKILRERFTLPEEQPVKTAQGAAQRVQG